MIKWDKYFDHIYSIGYVKRDISKLQSELSRIGILNSGIYSHEYSLSSSLINNIKHLFWDETISSYLDNSFYYGFDVTLSHYKVIKEAYELGYDHILIIEDDSIFRNDVNEIERILDNIPENYTLTWLNWFTSYDYCPVNLLDEYNEYYWKHHFVYDNKYYLYLFSAASYCLNREGMQFVIDYIESMKISNIDNILLIMTNSFENCYVSKNKISIQVKDNMIALYDYDKYNTDNLEDFNI